MNNNSSTKALLFDGEIKRPQTIFGGLKFQKLSQNRGAIALLLGVFCGFAWPCFFVHNDWVHGKYTRSNDLMDEKVEIKMEAEIAESNKLALFLQDKIRVFCIVMADGKGLNSSAEIIMNTWGKRCTKTLFFSDEVPSNLNLSNMVLVNKTDSFAKLREAYKYVHLKHPNEFDWILKTNIIAFVVLENLRHFLYQYDSDWPLIVGQRTLDGDYMLGVFALSKRAFTRLLEDAFTNTGICALTGHEDREVMKCLEHVNVIKIDGIDRQGKGMIFKHGPEPLLLPEQVEDPNKNYVHKFKQGFENCCSERLIATQSVWATELYYMEYFIYKVHAFGVCQKSESLPEKFTLDEVLLSHL